MISWKNPTNKTNPMGFILLNRYLYLISFTCEKSNMIFVNYITKWAGSDRAQRIIRIE